MSEITDQFQRYRQAGIMVDTNILLLFFIGAFDQNLIPRFKRTRQFTVEDYATLIDILGPFDKIVATPHILTEVSNLSGQLREPARSEYFKKFSSGITLLEEKNVAKRKCSSL